MEIDILFIAPNGDMMVYNSGGFRMVHKGDKRSDLQKQAKVVYHIMSDNTLSKSDSKAGMPEE